jgi:lipoic acid synthetase
MTTQAKAILKKPNWLKARAAGGENYLRLKQMMSELGLATVCQEAKCPNIGECWNGGTATIMLMGDTCTRGCRFCNVKTGNPRGKIDEQEPEKVGTAIAQMNLDYVVLTSVDRDDLPDQGAAHFARTIEVIKSSNSKILVEVLTPDFRGDRALVEALVNAKPDVFAHNVETVERLTKRVRDPRAGYRQSLNVLKWVKEIDPSRKTKSSIMLGLGETDAEILQTLRDLREVDCDVVTFGQYLQPTLRHLKVEAFIAPEEFARWQTVAESLGFLYVASGPMVRSSYRAGEFFMKAMIENSRSSLTHNDAREIERETEAETIAIEDWGLIEYSEALKRQEAYVEEVANGARQSTLVFCSHPPVVTTGRRTQPEEVEEWRGPIVAVSRGGKATYHGPNQIIVYPIIDLKKFKKDVTGLLRTLEQCVVSTLDAIGIEATGQNASGETGVWVANKKIASLGIAIRHWVSYHGLALNGENDPNAFKGIKPCGLSRDAMTTVEALVQDRPSSFTREQLQTALAHELKLAFAKSLQLEGSIANRNTQPSTAESASLTSGC